MKILPKRNTDAEHVESVRTMIRRSKGRAVFHGAMACFFIAAYFVFHRFIFKMDDVAPGLASSLEPGVKIGIVLGVMQGFMIMFAAFNIGSVINTLRGQRTERLMLQFHDDLEKHGDCQQPTPPYSEPAARSPQG